METVKINLAVNYVKSFGISMALLGCLVLSATARASAQSGWAVGNKGTILYTPDGKDWQAEAPPKETPNFNAVASVDGKTAWAVGEAPKLKSGQPGGPGTILYFDGTVKDKKQVWVFQNKNDKGKPIPSVNLNGVSFADSTHGWIVGDVGTILWTKGTNGRIWASLPNPFPGKTTNLYGVFLKKFRDKYYGWAVGANGAVVYSDPKGTGMTWTPGKGTPNDQGAFRSVSASLLTVKNDVPVFYVIAVGDQGLGVWQSIDSGQNWTQGDKLPGQKDIKVVQMLTLADIWAGQTSANDVFQRTSMEEEWQNVKTGKFNDVYGLSGLLLNGVDNIWVVGENGNIAYRTKTQNQGYMWTSQGVDGVKEQLNGIVMVKPPTGGKSVKLEESASPESGAAGANYVSITGSGFPEGDISAANVVVELTAECHEDASAVTSALSMVSGSGDNELVSFLLPSSLAPGQYFVSISDLAEGDANFESSNCSSVTVVQ